MIAACVVPAEIGFDCSNDVPFYGFACNGGVIDFSNKSFDFSGASACNLHNEKWKILTE